MAFFKSSVMSLVALGCCIAAFLFHIIGFPSNGWCTYSFASVGLFRYCYLGYCLEHYTSSPIDWLSATIAMEIMGFLCGWGSLVVIIVYVTIKNDLKLLQIVALGTAFAAGTLIMLGVIIFGAKYEEVYTGCDLGWSFALTIIGGLIYLVTGAMLVVDKVMV